MGRCQSAFYHVFVVSIVGLYGCGSNPLVSDEISEREPVTGSAASAAASTKEEQNKECLRLQSRGAGASGDLKTKGGPGGEPLPPGAAGPVPPGAAGPVPCGVPPNGPTPAGPGVPPPGAPVVPPQAVPEPLPPFPQAPFPGGPAPCASKWACKFGKHWGGTGGGFGGKGGFWGGKAP